MTQAQIWTAVLSVLGSSIGAFVAVKLAYGKFRSERLWDARYHQFTEILNVVHQIEAAADFRLAMLSHEPTRVDGSGSDSASRAELERFTAIAGLLHDNEFCARINELDYRLWQRDRALVDDLRGEVDELMRETAQRFHANEVRNLAIAARHDLQDIARASIGTSRVPRWLVRLWNVVARLFLRSGSGRRWPDDPQA
ncbi:hypothetical protein [Luteimonas sp. 3794]|uniref:hypothetical protein n=1 Tax=Luteimonas sp. 3794 TaxID=2817730 RepID=UPI002855FB51|nr:hypothetical protein [Luteimonas sp. 3794]MDR6992457.1 hypothetical protein [Luteimonas sp. 3794]